MIENQKIRPDRVIGPLGEPLTIDSLPPPETTRWVVRRKAEVVAAVNGGLLNVDEVCERYNLTAEEFAGWQRAIDRSGMPGLRVTRIQHYRSLYERQQQKF
ncbi:CtrA inhibitor SciP [Sphingomonas sp. RS2018]